MEQEKLGTGAIESTKDLRTVKHEDLVQATAPLITGGITYTDHEHQHLVGICTAISRVQLRERQTGKKYSPEFHYLMTKKFYDLNWNEGSSLLNSNKVAKNIGFLPIELFTYASEADRYLPYSQYIAKLQAIPDAEIARLRGLCVDSIKGYASIDVSDPQAIAKAVVESPNQAGILCMYPCQKNWWSPSWAAKDIDPLRNGQATSGHAIILSSFDYTTGNMQLLANSWGNTWCLNGNAHINWNDYPMKEAWIDLLQAPVIKFIFTKVLKVGMFNADVKQLQIVLNKYSISVGTPDGIFGLKTLKSVQAFQTSHGLFPDGIVGNATNTVLNQLI